MHREYIKHVHSPRFYSNAFPGGRSVGILRDHVYVNLTRATKTVADPLKECDRVNDALPPGIAVLNVDDSREDLNEG
jgi:hypothetical protein